VTFRHHLNEDRLFECYLTLRQGDTLDPRHAEHLADCGACAARYGEIVSVMNEVSAAADADTDAVFTAERLHAQRQSIVRRLEHVGRPARVLTFPRLMHADGLHPASGHSPSRWVTAAAAAGLFIGVALGASFHWSQQADSVSAAAAPPSIAEPMTEQPIAIATDGLRTATPDIAADDAFLSELERSADRPRTRELLPVDSLTPHVREISAR
jgi:hypothetical protein